MISVTSNAADYLKSQLNSRDDAVGVRIGVKTSGCSGLGYVLEFVYQLETEDQVFDSHGVSLVIDPKSLVYLDGTCLELVKEGLNTGLQFQNPNVKDQCGCGESFNI